VEGFRVHLFFLPQHFQKVIMMKEKHKGKLMGFLMFVLILALVVGLLSYLGIIYQGTKTIEIGLHNIDLSYNILLMTYEMNGVTCKNNQTYILNFRKLEDITSTGSTMAYTELYRIGLSQIRIGSARVLFGGLGFGIHIGLIYMVLLSTLGGETNAIRKKEKK
jgi:hypothetical protein